MPLVRRLDLVASVHCVQRTRDVAMRAMQSAGRPELGGCLRAAAAGGAMNRRAGTRSSDGASHGRNTRKLSRSVSERLEELDCDPIADMVRLARDESLSPVLRARMIAELATYVAPRRKSVDLAGAEGTLLNLVPDFNMSGLTDQELQTLIDLLSKGQA
jgi:hypothetical protein